MRRLLIIAALAGVVAIAYRFVIPAIISLYSHPEKVSDRSPGTS
jgi:hypothetical protein